MKIQTTEDMQDMLAEDAMQLDGLDDAIIGVSTQGYIVYSYWKIVQKFISDDGMTDEEALEYTDYNVVGLDGNGNWVIMYDREEDIVF